MSRTPSWVACLLGLAGAAALAAAPSDEEELAAVYGDKALVSIASGAPQALRRAPSAATVITAEDIRASGATELDEILEMVPGLHVSRSPIAYTPLYTFRGIVTQPVNPQVLMLINGIPATSVYAGDRNILWGGMPLENVARIEVIRGPGSALYGADAFAGVINVITKNAADIQGTQLGLRIGSFDSRRAWALHGAQWGEVAVAAYFGAGHTEGAKPIVERDAQSGLDAIFAAFGVPPVSRAPGPISIGYDGIDAGIDLALRQWRLRASFKQRSHMGTGAGVASALDPSRNNSMRRFTADLTYQDPNFAPGWDVSLQASLMQQRELANLVLFPAGSNLGFGSFQDGMIGNPWRWERHTRFNASALYSGHAAHRVRVGAGHQIEDLYKIRESKNFNPGFSPIGTGSFADVTDVSDTLPYIRPHLRRVSYVFLQDEWNLAPDWALTAGVRRDHYSDFGSTTNPRLALVWDAAYDLTAKLLYGTAFRAPAFEEQYVLNNPVAIGNESLRPEKIRTLEAVLSWQASARLQLAATLFRYRLSDLIHLDSTLQFANGGRQDGHGLELEATWDASAGFRLAGNLGLQRATDAASGQSPGLAPRRHLNLRADWRFLAGWLANAQLNHIGGRQRQAGDTRPPVADYTTLDLTLRSERGRGAWEFALSVRNLLNADVREPSAFGTPFVSIPNDLPLAGRSIYVQAIYRL